MIKAPTLRSRNFGLAAKAMVAFAILSEGLMLVFPGMSIHMMFLFLLDLPVVAFFLVFFFGHHLTCTVRGSHFWVDKLCVDQTDEITKSEGIACLPTIVANSSQMLPCLYRLYPFEWFPKKI